MKRIKINKGKVGLVFAKGDYKKTLTHGTYWVSFFSKIMEFDMAKPFIAPIELNILLQDPKLANLLNVVEVQDSEIALQYENGNFKNILTAGRYAFWKEFGNVSFVKVGLGKIEITEKIAKTVLDRKELAPYLRVFAVEPYEKGILWVDGKMNKILESGVYYFWKNSTPIAVVKADLRQIQMEVSGQEILTKDKAAIRVNFYTQFQINDLVKSLVENKDYDKQLYVLIQLALREFVGTFSLDELLEKKEAVAEFVMNSLKEKTQSLGVEIKDCGVKDIILPGEMKEIMNQVLVAQKKAQANIIARREETASTRSMLNTAKLLEENEMLFKLKEMEYVEKIAEKINNITLSGGGQIVEQLKDIFGNKK